MTRIRALFGPLVALTFFACDSDSPGGEPDSINQSEQAITDQCRSVTLTASRSYKPAHWDDAIVDLSPSLRFAIPTELEVTTGNAGKKFARLIIKHPDGSKTRCRYQGDNKRPHNNALGHGDFYVFSDCQDGSQPGDVVDATRVKLRVQAGERKSGTTTATVTLTEEEPCAGGGGNGGGGSGGAPNTGGNSSAGGAPPVGGSAGTGASTSGTGASTSGTGGSTSGTGGSTTGTGGAGGGGGGPVDLCAPELVDDGDACTIERSCDPLTGHIERTVCTALDPTVATTMKSALGFLYEGANPLQQGVAPDTIEEARAAGLMGYVSLPDGSRAQGARITVLDHPELGSTHTDLTGHYVMAVNGGAALTVNIELDGYLSAQRTAPADWQSYAQMDDAILVATDPNATVIDLSGGSAITVATGTQTADDRGMRQGVLMVPPGTNGSLQFADGSTEALDAMTLHITEYTVGPDGPARMPGKLPETSIYTYAIELSTDEAEDAGATGVVFDAPVPYFVENFRDIPVGLAVPVGHYDRARGVWVPDEDGVVIAITGITNGVADIDFTGDGAADLTQDLTNIGLTPTVRAELASRYAVGSEVWYAPLKHFSPADLNYGKRIPDPKRVPPAVAEDAQTDCSVEEEGSILECDNQVLGESVPVAGTPFSLDYRSNRVPGGAGRRVTVAITDSDPPTTALAINARLSVAGRVIEQTVQCPCAANMSATLEWDGADAFGRTVTGSQPAQLEVGYVYEADQAATQYKRFGRSFAAFTNEFTVIDNGPQGGRWQLELTNRKRIDLDNWSNGGQGLGGFSLSEVHAYDPVSGTLWRGDGTRRHQDYQNVIHGIMERPTTGIFDVAPLPNGSVLYYTGSQLFERQPDGTTTLVAGRATPSSTCQNGEGIPAIGACAAASGLSLLTPAPDGSIYALSGQSSRIIRVAPDGMLSFVAGTGTAGSTGDGGPALSANIRPTAMAMSADGSLYIGETARVRRISTDGYINTVVGGGTVNGDGIPANQVSITSAINALAFGPDDSLYLLHDAAGGLSRLRRVPPTGIIETVAGAAPQQTGEGIFALHARMSQANQLAVGRDGVIYLSDVLPGLQNRVIRAITPDGRIRTVAGAATCTDCPVTGNAYAASLPAVRSMRMGPDGYLVFHDINAMLRLSANLPKFVDQTFAIAETDGRTAYIFDQEGRHLSTLDTETGRTLLSIDYDAFGQLSSVTDQDGLITTIERDNAGV
ncbi:MAG: hypothetical protein U0271_35620, partial [Polyangiaceae bacterium]